MLSSYQCWVLLIDCDRLSRCTFCFYPDYIDIVRFASILIIYLLLMYLSKTISSVALYIPYLHFCAPNDEIGLSEEISKLNCSPSH